MGRLLPGFAVAALVDRFVTIMDRVQLRDMNFRRVGLIRSVGELTYTVVSVGLAAFAAGTAFGGGMALVYGTLARAASCALVALSAATAGAGWWNPARLTWARTREFFRFGLPMWIVTLAGFGAQRFDNFVFSHHFGPANAGIYNLAYNFADLPASIVSETVGDVLVPSFANMENDDERRHALLLSLRMLTLLVCAPLTVGLAIVAPTLVKLAFTDHYIGVYRLLRILALFGVARTIGWIGNSYLQVRNEPRTIMVLETALMVGIVVIMHLFVVFGRRFTGGHHGVIWACASVVFVFNASALSYMWAIRRLDGISLRDQILPLVPPILATVPMVLAVYGMRHLMLVVGIFPTPPDTNTTLERIIVFGPRLLLEIVVGAVAVVPSAFVIAPRASREFIHTVKDALAPPRRQRARRRGPRVSAIP